MKKAVDWNFEYSLICANDPAVKGQLLPNPQNIAFIKRVQADAIDAALDVVSGSADENMIWAERELERIKKEL